MKQLSEQQGLLVLGLAAPVLFFNYSFEEVEIMLMSIRTAARELGCSAEHAWRMVKVGKWPAYRLGPKTTRLDVEEIKALGRLKFQAEYRKAD